MKKTVFVAALTAAALSFSGLVLAEGAEGDNRTAPGPQQQRLQREPGARPDDAPGLRQQQRGQRGVRPGYEGRYGEQQRMQRRPIIDPNEQQLQYWAQTPRYQGRGAGPNRDFNRGGRLPEEYRGR